MGTNRIDLIGIKVKRAKEHIRDLGTRVRAFRKPNPHDVIREEDPESGDIIYRLKIIRDVPIEWAAIVGDAVQNLRTSLDHLAWQLVLANGGTPDKYTGFPIVENPTEYKALSAGKVKGMNQTAIDKIEALKPYKGGNDALWKIHRLNITDKHQLLLAVGSIHSDIIVDLSDRFPFLKAIGQPIVIAPAQRIFPLKDGAELHRWPKTARLVKMDKDPKFTFEIAFGNSEVVDGEPVMPTLQQLADFVDSVISNFASLL